MPRGGGGRQQSSTLHFDAEFDFETSNAQFDKVQIEKELKEKLTLGMLMFEKTFIGMLFSLCIMMKNKLNQRSNV